MKKMINSINIKFVIQTYFEAFYLGFPLVSHHACPSWALEERSFQRGFPWSEDESTVTGATEAGGVPS